MEIIVHRAEALITLDEKVLLVRNQQTRLQLPGGVQKPEESGPVCIRRSIADDIPDLIVDGQPKHWRLFKDLRSPLSGFPMTVSVYRVEIDWSKDDPTESTTEFLWWQRGLDESELTEPTCVILEAAEAARLFN